MMKRLPLLVSVVILFLVPPAAYSDTNPVPSSVFTPQYIESVKKLLNGFNYLMESSKDGSVKVIVTGENGSGANNAVTPNLPATSLLRYQPIENLPAELSALHQGSVSVVVFPKKEMLAMKFGETGSLDLPIGEWKVVHDNKMKHANGDVTWTAKSDQYGVFYRATITFGKKETIGTIYAPEGNYEIKTVKGTTYLVDVEASGLKRFESSLPSEIVLPNGKIASPEGGSPQADPAPSITLSAPYYGKAGTGETISWTSTADLDQSLPLSISYSKNGGATFAKAGKSTLGNGSMTWVPKGTTKNGVLRACVTPSGATSVCGYANVFVLGKKSVFTPPDAESVPPTSPTWISGVGKKASVVFLSATPATDNAQVMGYNLYKDGKFFRSATTTGMNVKVKKNSSVLFSWESFDSSGNKSPRSLEMAITSPLSVPTSDTALPTQPLRLTASLSQSNAIALSWMKSADNKAIGKYNIYRNGEFYVSVKGN